MRAQVLAPALAAFCAAHAWAFEPEGHHAVLEQGNIRQGTWREKENACLSDWNDWVDWGCNGSVPRNVWCAEEWHVDDDTVIQSGPSGMTALRLMDEAWDHQVVAAPSDVVVEVKASIAELWKRVQTEKPKACAVPQQGCLPRRLLDKADRAVRQSLGIRSHTTHDFYSHTTYVEKNDCAGSLPFTKNPNVAFPPGAARFRVEPAAFQDTKLRSGFWLHNMTNLRTYQRLEAPRNQPDWKNLETEDGQKYKAVHADNPFKVESGVPVGGTDGGSIDDGKPFFLHDGWGIRTGIDTRHYQGLNKDKPWNCERPTGRTHHFPCQGGGFCTGDAVRAYKAAINAAADQQKEENVRLCNAIKEVLGANGGGPVDVMAVWFYVTGTEACGCKPLVFKYQYWAK